jgi:hypothetical protein
LKLDLRIVAALGGGTPRRARARAPRPPEQIDHIIIN